MQIWPLIARLRDTDLCPSLNGRVEPLWGLNQPWEDKELVNELPIAYVALESDSAQPSADMGEGCLSQRVNAFISVRLVVEPPREDSDPFDSALNEIRQAMAGHQPSDAEGQLELQGGDVVFSNAGRVVWQDRYSVPYRIRIIT